MLDGNDGRDHHWSIVKWIFFNYLCLGPFVLIEGAMFLVFVLNASRDERKL